MHDDTSGMGAAQGLSWSWELDFAALLECLTEPGPHDPPGSRLGPASSGPAPSGPASSHAPGPGTPDGADPGGGEAAHGAVPGDPDDLDVPGDRVPAGALAGRLAGRLAPGPDLAAWLSLVPAGELGDADLAATAGGWRRLASWAQSRELAAVAQIASRSAARDQDIGTGDDGRPARVPASAAAEVALELAMSRFGAAGWADLAVELGWRLAATGAALESGDIDVYRARLIAEATGPLSDEAARAVEEKVLPAAGRQTPGMLRAALRRAVLTADPKGAEERRKESERQAKVVLYPDEDHTATLAGQRLPVIHAAAAMARIKAMARAWKTSGAAGGIDLLSAKIYVGLLLGTLPLIPPPEDAPPDNPPGNPGDDPGDPGNPGGGPGDRSDGPGARAGPGRDPLSACPPSSNPPSGNRPPSGGSPGDRPDANSPGDRPPRSSPPDRLESNGLPGDGIPRDEVPPPGDQDAPGDEEDYPCAGDSPAGNDRFDENDGDGGWQDSGPPPDWPALPEIPLPPARPATGGAGPVPGLLDVTLPWPVLAGASDRPGFLGRIGPIPADQARALADCAARDPAAEWRIVITTPAGRAIAVTRIPRARGPARPPQPGSGPGIGLVGRITLTIPEDILASPPHGPRTQRESGPGPEPTEPDPTKLDSTEPDPTGPILPLALHAAARARAAAAADAAAGGCAHTTASPGYRPPPRLRDHVVARDLTCRSPVCRQPAWRGELDHTVPWDQGPTCVCNLGGVCKADHLLKHHPDWKLAQTAPGMFIWTTPSGRIFTVTPDTHPR